jgi:hypothetical protein
VLEAEMAEPISYSANTPEKDLLALLDVATKAIRTLEQRVAMQERTYVTAMQEKNRKIRELQLCLQSRH